MNGLKAMHLFLNFSLFTASVVVAWDVGIKGLFIERV